MPKYSDRPCARCGKNDAARLLQPALLQSLCPAGAQRRRHHQPGQTAQQTCHERDRPRGARRPRRRQDLWLLCGPA